MKNKILPVLFAFVVVFATNQASAYYSPSTGRWLSRDPMGEPGFELLRASSVVPKVGQVVSPASFPPSRLFVRDPIVEKKCPNLYGFVQNTPIQLIDSYGLTPTIDINTSGYFNTCLPHVVEINNAYKRALAALMAATDSGQNIPPDQSDLGPTIACLVDSKDKVPVSCPKCSLNCVLTKNIYDGAFNLLSTVYLCPKILNNMGPGEHTLGTGVLLEVAKSHCGLTSANEEDFIKYVNGLSW